MPEFTNPEIKTVILDSPAGTSEAPRPETTPSTPETPRFTKKQKLIAALAGGALLAGGAFGLGLAANSGEKPAEAPANTSEPVDPVEPVEPAPVEEPTTPEVDTISVEALEIPAGLNAEELAKVIVEDRFTDWDNASATQNLFNKVIEENKSWNELLPEIAAQNRDIFAESLYVSGWEQDPELAQNVEAKAESNLAVLGNYVQTAFKTDGPAVEAYYIDTVVKSASESSGENGERILTIDVGQTDNREQNQITTTELRDARYIITLIEENGKEKIANIEVDIL